MSSPETQAMREPHAQHQSPLFRLPPELRNPVLEVAIAPYQCNALLKNKTHTHKNTWAPYRTWEPSLRAQEHGITVALSILCPSKTPEI